MSIAGKTKKMSRVVIFKSRDAISLGMEINKKALTRMFEKGLSALIEKNSLTDSLRALFPENSRIGIKINTIGGKNISTRPEVSICLADILANSDIQDKNIIIWDRTNRELRDAGYRLNMNRSGISIYGTDTQGVGYKRDLVSHLNVGSLFSSIQSDRISSSISLAILKDHGMAGVTAGMKNYFGAIHNPNKYHDTNCNPYVAEVFDTEEIKKKHKLSIVDGLVVQYHRGPSYHAKWADPQGILIFSLDPVAADFVGWQVIEKLRAQKGLPTLKEENREPLYLKTAEKMRLGKASAEKIALIELEG
jgi:uncharacterized protein (DUF362 family)